MREKINDILFFLGLRFKRKLSVNSNAALIPSVCFLFDFKSKKKSFFNVLADKKFNFEWDSKSRFFRS
jgi:hypothetical protein